MNSLEKAEIDIWPVSGGRWKWVLRAVMPNNSARDVEVGTTRTKWGATYAAYRATRHHEKGRK